MKAFVTGSAGFIGQNLVRLLIDQGVIVTGYDVRPADFAAESYHHVVGDVLDRELLAQVLRTCAPDLVFHLAAEHDLANWRNEAIGLAAYRTNTEGTRNIIELLEGWQGMPPRLIHFSSQMVCRPGYVPKSDQDYAPHTHYGRSKMLTEEALAISSIPADRWVVVRPTTVWGPGMSAHYRRFIRSVERGYYFHIGTGDYRKSYGYVGNFCHQIWTLAKADWVALKRRTFYVADYEPLSLKVYADLLAANLGGRKVRSLPLPVAKAFARVGDALQATVLPSFPFTSFRVRNITTEYQFDLEPIRAICPVLPYDIPSGVSETVRWYRALEPR